jgi:hypothetical protein
LTSKDENKIITKLSPFILEKWLKSTVGEVRNVTKMKSGSLLVECYRQQQSINLLSAFLTSPTVLFSHFSKIKGDNLVIILFSSLLVKTLNLGHVFIYV